MNQAAGSSAQPALNYRFRTKEKLRSAGTHQQGHVNNGVIGGGTVGAGMAPRLMQRPAELAASEHIACETRLRAAFKVLRRDGRARMAVCRCTPIKPRRVDFFTSTPNPSSEPA